MHMFPQLRKLEQKYADHLAVIGVHSAKFTTERETENIRNAVLRYNIQHPVVNDADFRVWRTWGIRAWPTLMFVDPHGRVIGKHEGELPYEDFDRLVGDMLSEFGRVGALDPKRLPYQLEAEREAARPLSFPGKIAVDPDRNRLFVADSNHARVLVADMDGNVADVIGSGEIGAADGAFGEASFWRPQGMAVDGDNLYIADAENHNIRRADLSERTVSTIAGTGEQSLLRHRGGDPLSVPLNSPYDLALHDGVLYIAMAGFHQLWALDLQAKRIYPYAGSGREDIVDDTLADAQLAQPYGIDIHNGTIYFTDSETSSVRTAGIGADARVHTLVGTGLFDFGDRDDVWTAAQLQHVQGLSVGDGVVYLADTYNHKVKRLNLVNGFVKTIAGTGRRGHDDGPAEAATFDEPADVALAGDRLYVADTNNHAIRILHLDTMAVSTLQLTGLQVPAR